MKIDLKHIAQLSKIKLSDEELNKFPEEMQTILESVDVLKDVDTDGINPMKNRVSFSDLREDIVKDSLEQEDVLKNAPHSEKGFVKVYGEVFGEGEES